MVCSSQTFQAADVTNPDLFQVASGLCTFHRLNALLLLRWTAVNAGILLLLFILYPETPPTSLHS